MTFQVDHIVLPILTIICFVLLNVEMILRKPRLKRLNEAHWNILNAYLLMKMVLQTERVTRNLVVCLNIFYNINFTNFFISYHDYLFEQFSNKFIVCGSENEFGDDEGEFLDCEFNPKFTQQEKNKFIRMILRW